MAMTLVHDGPTMDWTMDNKIYDRYLIWKSDVELIFSSALLGASPLQKSSYLRLWMGKEAKPLLQKWISTKKLDLSTEEEAAKKKPNFNNLSNGFIIQTYWDLLEEELKPKGNKILSILELLSDRSKQGSKPLNDWLSYVFNLVETCEYGNSKDRIIRDILIKGCASDKARESIIRRGDKIKHSEVIEILQTEDATSSTYETLKEFDSTSRQIQPATVHYASYKKSKKSKQNSNSNDTSSSQCFRCGQPFSKEHLKVCKAQNVHCNECGKHGHFQIVCKSLGQFPKRAQRQQNSNSTDRRQTHYVSDTPVQSATGFYNEQGNWVAEPPRPSPVIQKAHLVSVKQKVPAIQDIHPEIDPETSLMQGMAKSQFFPSENSKTFNFSRDAVSPRSGSNLQALSTEKQPIRQKSTNSFSSPVLQASQRSPRDQDIQNSTNVSVQSFHDTETDPETHSKVKGLISKKFQVSHFRGVPEFFQKKEEIVLQLPIKEIQFQQFCKLLNVGELFQCRDLLEKELYGK